MENIHSIQAAFSKISAQMQTLSQHGNLSEIEHDLLLENIRDFYTMVKHCSFQVETSLQEEQKKEGEIAATMVENYKEPSSVQTNDMETERVFHDIASNTPVHLESLTTELVTETEVPTQEVPLVSVAETMETDKDETASPLSFKESLLIIEDAPSIDAEKKSAVDTLFDFEAEAQRSEEVVQSEERIPEVLNYLNQNLHHKKKLPDSSSPLAAAISAAKEPLAHKTVADRFSPARSLADRFSFAENGEGKDIANKIGTSHKDFRNAIGVNEKFMFINDLFAGNMRSYTDFISQLNKGETKTDALLLIKQMAETRHWVETSFAYSTLISMVDKKFAK